MKQFVIVYAPEIAALYFQSQCITRLLIYLIHFYKNSIYFGFKTNAVFKSKYSDHKNGSNPTQQKQKYVYIQIIKWITIPVIANKDLEHNIHKS